MHTHTHTHTSRLKYVIIKCAVYAQTFFKEENRREGVLRNRSGANGGKSQRRGGKGVMLRSSIKEEEEEAGKDGNKKINL